jgi:hypothetical protein
MPDQWLAAGNCGKNPEAVGKTIIYHFKQRLQVS